VSRCNFVISLFPSINMMYRMIALLVAGAVSVNGLSEVCESTSRCDNIKNKCGADEWEARCTDVRRGNGNRKCMPVCGQCVDYEAQTCQNTSACSSIEAVCGDPAWESQCTAVTNCDGTQRCRMTRYNNGNPKNCKILNCDNVENCEEVLDACGADHFVARCQGMAHCQLGYNLSESATTPVRCELA